MSSTDDGRGHRRLPRPGRASDYISHLDLPPGAWVVLCCRISAYQQKHRGTLPRQVRNLCREMRDRGLHVADIVTHVGSGVDPAWLVEAADAAKLYGATLVAESTDRFIRSSRYSKTLQDVQATEDDLRYMAEFTDGVPMATVVHPDGGPGEARSYQCKRGQRATGNAGGAPAKPRPGYKKQRRLALLPRVVELREAGLSYRQIAKSTGVRESTARLWLSRG